MNKVVSRKLLKQLKAVFIFEEKDLLDFLYDCYGKLPGDFNEKELKRTEALLDVLMVQSLNHANIITDLITKFYGKSPK